MNASAGKEMDQGGAPQGLILADWGQFQRHFPSGASLINSARSASPFERTFRADPLSATYPNPGR
jgi:hypothetical protein